MKFLPPSYFIQLPVKRVPAWPVLLDPDGEKRFKGLAAFLERLERDGPNMQMDGYFPLLKEFVTPESFSENYELGISSAVLKEAYASPKDWENWINQVWVVSPRYFDPTTHHPGGGRHVYIGDFEFKGIGRTPFAVRKDWQHSWGGLLLYDGLTEMALSMAANLRAPDSNLMVRGVLSYDEKIQADSKSFLLRDIGLPRMDQIPYRLPRKDRGPVRKWLEEEFDESDSSAIHNKIVDRILNFYKQGLIHFSPTANNILIDGHFLDHHSTDVLSLHETPYYYRERDGMVVDSTFKSMAHAFQCGELRWSDLEIGFNSSRLDDLISKVSKLWRMDLSSAPWKSILEEEESTKWYSYNAIPESQLPYKFLVNDSQMHSNAASLRTRIEKLAWFFAVQNHDDPFSNWKDLHQGLLKILAS